MTEGLSPGINKAFSVCTYDHAEHAWQGLKELIEQLKTSGKKAKILKVQVMQKQLVKVLHLNIF